VTRIEPKPLRGPVSSTIRNTGEALHWLRRRLGRPARSHVAGRVLDIWREGGRSLLRDHLLSETASARRDTRYQQWRRDVEPGLFAGVVVDAGVIDRGPTFTVIVPVFDTDPAMLRACIESVLRQTYPKWTLRLIDDASTRADTRAALAPFADRDDRIRIIHRPAQGGISAATNDGLSAAQGEFIALLDHDDELSPHALAAMARQIDAHRNVDVLYSDEDKIDERGQRSTPVFKPALSPHHLFTSNYCCHLLVVRTELMRELGGLRAAFNGAQDYDLVLRCLERSTRFTHVPLVLYHWRTHAGSTSGAGRAKPYAAEAGRQALVESMRRCDIDGVVEHSPFLLSYRVRPTVSLDDQVDVVRTGIDGLAEPRDWSAHRGEDGSRWVLFLSRGVAGPDAAQVRALIEAAKTPHSGPVGGVVVGRAGTILDAGWLVDREGYLRGRYLGYSAVTPAVGWALRLPRNVSIVGPWCLLVERTWAQRAMVTQRGGNEAWWITLARLMRAEGRVAQVVGEVQVMCRGDRTSVPMPRAIDWLGDGLLSEHLAYVEPEYVSPRSTDECDDRVPVIGMSREDRCAASSA